MLAEMTATIIFYLLAIVTVAAAIATVTTVRILRSAIFLAAVLLCNAGFFILLDFEFLAGVQVLVYVGGIVVLLVFAIMLTSSITFIENQPATYRIVFGLVTASGFFVVILSALSLTEFPLATTPVQIPSDVAAIGRSLLDYGSTGYVLPFEIISLLLLAVMIGGIVIARKPQPSKKEGE